MANALLTADPEISSAIQLNELLDSGIIARQAWNILDSTLAEILLANANHHGLLAQLMECQLLTPFQARRLAIGQGFGLMLGDYRVLDRLGSGGTSVVFRGEHIQSLRPVALKVLPNLQDADQRILDRF